MLVFLVRDRDAVRSTPEDKADRLAFFPTWIGDDLLDDLCQVGSRVPNAHSQRPSCHLTEACVRARFEMLYGVSEKGESASFVPYTTKLGFAVFSTVAGKFNPRRSHDSTGGNREPGKTNTDNLPNIVPG